jgi:hypothetical protein
VDGLANAGGRMRKRHRRKARRKLAAAKLAALVLYLIQQGQAWGATKREAVARIAWLAFHADFEAFGRLGQSITGGQWIKGRSHPEWRLPA